MSFKEYLKETLGESPLKDAKGIVRILSPRSDGYDEAIDANDISLRQFVNDPQIAVHENGKATIIGSGQSDKIGVFATNDGKEIIIVSVNPRMGYVGIEAFDENMEKLGEVFLQNESDVAEASKSMGVEDITDEHPQDIAEFLYNNYLGY